MKHYTATIKLRADANMEVLKTGLSAAEILVLRAVHGDEAVRVHPGSEREAKVDAAEVRDFLARKYGDEIVAKTFGPSHARLPEELPDMVDQIVAEQAPARRGRKPTVADVVDQPAETADPLE